jgi:hypothetical protein
MMLQFHALGLPLIPEIILGNMVVITFLTAWSSRYSPKVWLRRVAQITLILLSFWVFHIVFQGSDLI